MSGHWNKVSREGDGKRAMIRISWSLGKRNRMERRRCMTGIIICLRKASYVSWWVKRVGKLSEMGMIGIIGGLSLEIGHKDLYRA